MNLPSWARLIVVTAAIVCAPAGVRSEQSVAAAPIEIVPNIPHAFGVHSIAWSPDGRLVASGGSDSAVKLWDVATGRLLRTLIGHVEPLKSVAFSPDGATVVSGGDDNTVKLWDVVTGRLLRTFLQEVPVESAKFSPDGKHLLIASGGISLVELATGKTLFKIDEFYAKTLAVSPDGSRIAAGSNFGNSVKMWDASSGKLLLEFKGSASTGIPVFAPDRDQLSPITITAVAFSPDGERIMAGSSDQEAYNPRGISDHVVNIWDTKTGRLLTTFSGHSESVAAVAFSPDGKRGGSVSTDKTIKIWEADTGRLLRTIPIGGYAPAVAFAPDWKEVLSGDNGLSLWDTETGHLKGKFGSPNISSVDSAGFSPTGNDLVSGSDDDIVRLWNLKNGTLRQSFAGSNVINFLPDGQRLVSIEKDGVKTWNAADGKPLTSFGGQRDWKEAIAISHDGTRVLLGSKEDKPLELWEIASGRLVRRFMAFSSVGAVAFSPDDRMIGAGLGALAKFWDTDSGKWIGAFTPFPDWGISTFTFSHDGKKVLLGGWGRASLSKESNLKLLDVSNGRTLREFFGHSSAVGAVAISRDDTRALSGSWDGTVRLWDLFSGRLIYTFVGSQGGINAVQFSPDGKRLLSAGADGAIRVWNEDNGELLVSIFELGDGEWVTITPEGFFVASEHGAAHLSVVQGLKVFGIDQVYQSLYRPDLVREKLAGDPRGLVHEAAAKLNLDKVIASGAAPVVRIVSPRNAERTASAQIAAEAQITSRDGGIGRVEWRVNGITVSVEMPTTTGISGQIVRLRHDLVVDEGDNVIEVVAYNSANFIASAPARATITAPAPTGVSQARLFVLAVGLNRYAEKRFDLTYAVPDAEALVRALQFAGKVLYKEVNVTLLSNEQVRRGQLDKAFSALTAAVRPNDVFVFYIAGHGKTVDGHYYFVPQDFRYDGDRSNTAALQNAVVRQGIDQDQWQAWFARIPARKSVLLFDTCEAGTLAGDTTLALEQGAASDRIAQATGRNILTASAGDKEALEGFRGHGLFTYSLLEALERADSNGDGKIDVAELAAYVHAKVTTISESVFKELQVPQVRITANYPVAEPAQILPNAPPDLVVADKPTDVLASKTELLVLPALGARLVRVLPAETPLIRLRNKDGWALVATHGQPIGYVATRELIPVH